MIADPDVHNDDVSKRYTHDTIRELSYYKVTKVDLGFVGSCMVHKGDLKIVAQMLRNLGSATGRSRLRAPLVVAAPTYNIIDEFKEEGDWDILQKYSGFEFDDNAPKSVCSYRIREHDVSRPTCMGPGCKGDTVLYPPSATALLLTQSVKKVSRCLLRRQTFLVALPPSKSTWPQWMVFN